MEKQIRAMLYKPFSSLCDGDSTLSRLRLEDAITPTAPVELLKKLVRCEQLPRSS